MQRLPSASSRTTTASRGTLCPTTRPSPSGADTRAPMAGALAWTLQLVFFVLIAQAVLTLIETVAFRYRAVSERSL